MRTAKLKSCYNLLIIGSTGLQCETNLKEIIVWESSDVVRYDLGPLLQSQMMIAKLKIPFNWCPIVFVLYYYYNFIQNIPLLPQGKTHK